MRSWTRAATLRRLARSGVPLSSLLRWRCTLASVCSSQRKKRGVATSCPSDNVAKVFNPTSLPTCRPVMGKGDGSAHSHEKQTDHLPVLLQLIVAVLGVPAI